MEDVQYIRGCSVLWRMLSTVKDIQYCKGCSVLWSLFSTIEDVCITVEDVWYYGGCCGNYHLYCGKDTINKCNGRFSVMWILTISTVEDTQYCGLKPQALCR